MKCLKQSKTRAIRAKRVSQKKTYEETTINHGAGKHLKISVETTSESFESFIGDSNAMASVTDTDDIMAFIRSSKDKELGAADYLDNEYTEIEEKISKGISAGLIGNAIVLLALGIAIGVTKGKILRKLF